MPSLYFAIPCFANAQLNRTMRCHRLAMHCLRVTMLRDAIAMGSVAQLRLYAVCAAACSFRAGSP